MDEIGDELLIYDLDSDAAHCLDQSAAAIWRACDGTQTLAGVAALTDQPEATVRSTVARLAALDLLRAGTFEADMHSRRTVLRRGLVVGAAGVAAVPVIRSIVAPAAALALSTCTPDGEHCDLGDPGACCSQTCCGNVSPFPANTCCTLSGARVDAGGQFTRAE